MDYWVCPARAQCDLCTYSEVCYWSSLFDDDFVENVDNAVPES